MGKARINIFFGAASVGSGPEAKITSAGQLQPILELLEKRGYQNIDTARVYAPGTVGTAEKLMGETFAVSESNYDGWTIDTKVLSFFPGAHQPATITKSVADSLDSLGKGRVHTLYLHSPDRQTSFEETYNAVQTAYEQGAFEKFGLSNYKAEEVEEFVQIGKKNGWVLPSVYQGQYNVIARNGEKSLFPTLREHNMAFFASSPLAGGFFTKIHTGHTKDSPPPEGSRFSYDTAVGRLYKEQYFKDELFTALGSLSDLAERHNVKMYALVLRWLAHHSLLDPKYGDAVIVGGSNVPHIEDGINALEEGPLPADVVEEFDNLWQFVEEVAPPYYL